MKRGCTPLSAVFRSRRSRAQARIPQGPADRAYDINYFARDVRRSALPGDTLIDDSFAPEAAKLLERPRLIDAPKLGSPGAQVRSLQRRLSAALRRACAAVAGGSTQTKALSRGPAASERDGCSAPHSRHIALCAIALSILRDAPATTTRRTRRCSGMTPRASARP